MKALVLSAGLGIRLKPLTNKIPKVMVKIGGKPLLWYHLALLNKHRIKDIWIAHHFYHEIIENYFGDGTKFGVKISYSYEKKLIGTAGALVNPDSKIEKELRKGTFLVVYGDNLSNFDYTRLIKFHKAKNALVTVGLYKSLEPWTMGVVTTKEDGKITAFVEKPQKDKVKSDLVSAGILVCEPEILNYIPKDSSSDFGFDILPKLLDLNKAVYAINTGSYVQDCGTLARLTKARNDFASGRCKFNFRTS